MRARRGMSIVEVIAATVIMAALLSSMSLAISRIVVQRHRLTQRSWANQAIANAMEQIDSLPYAQLTDSELGTLTLAENTEGVLPSATLQCTIVEQPETVPAKRIQITLRWQDGLRTPLNSLQLVSWRHPLDQTEP